MMASNLTGSFKDLKTYDFQTLYTKIPQDKLKDTWDNLFKETFQIKERKYINIQNNRAVFSDIKANKCGLTADELISYLDYSIDHAFVSFIDVVHRQVIGIQWVVAMHLI